MGIEQQTSQSAAIGIVPTAVQVGQFEGGLNINTRLQIETPSGVKDIMVRSPKPPEERAAVEASITEEYAAIGLTQSGVGFRLRSPVEQHRFMRTAHGLGLKALDSVVLLGDQMVSDFIPGVALNDYVRQPGESVNLAVIAKVLQHLSYAHSAGVVFGDRWTPNTLVTPDDGFVEIDFDIELLGDPKTTSTFELAQTVYHLLHFAEGNRAQVSGMITEVYENHPNLLAGYDVEGFVRFMVGHAEYFAGQYQQDGTLYEGVMPELEASISVAESMLRSYQSIADDPITNAIPTVKRGTAFE